MNFIFIIIFMYILCHCNEYTILLLYTVMTIIVNVQDNNNKTRVYSYTQFTQFFVKKKSMNQVIPDFLTKVHTFDNLVKFPQYHFHYVHVHDQ